MQPNFAASAFDGFALWITSLGSEGFFLLIAPAIYWCFSPKIGLRIGIYLAVSQVVNTLLKLAFHDPRPYWVDPKVRALTGESSFGMPSGHAQTSVVVWGGIAASLKSRIAWIVAVALMLLIGLSRLYLGVHSLDDVIVGWLVGALLLWGLLKLEPVVIPRIRRLTLARQISIAALVSVLVLVLALLIQALYGNWELPLEWIENAAAPFPDLEPINPASIQAAFTQAGIFFGFTSGAMWIWSRGGFQAHGSLFKLLLRFVLGLIGVMLIWAGLDMIFPSGEDIFSLSLRFLRYSLVTFWISGLAPYIFLRLKFAESE